MTVHMFKRLDPLKQSTGPRGGWLAGRALRTAAVVLCLAAAPLLLGCSWHQEMAGVGEAWDGLKNLAAPQQGAVSPKAHSIEKDLAR